MKGIYKDTNMAIKILQLAGIAFFCLFTGAAVGILLTKNIDSELLSLRILQFIQSVSTFLIPPFLLAYLWSTRPFEFLHLKQRISLPAALFIIIFMIIAIPFINLLADLNSQITLPSFLSGFEESMMAMEEQAAIQTEKLLSASTIGGLLFNIFLVAIIPAAGEEIFFRGTIQSLLQSNGNKIMAIWITAFIFSAIHFQFYGFIPRMLIGGFFGYLLIWSGSIWLPILAHFTNNAFAVVSHFLIQNHYITPEIDTIGSGSTWWLGCICGLVCLISIIPLKKRLSSRRH